MGQGEEQTPYFVRVQYNANPKFGIAVIFNFTKDFVETFDLNGKLIEFLADPSKKALAFRKLPTIKKEEWNKKTMKMLKIGKAGVGNIGAGSLMNAVGAEWANYKCPIETFKDDVYGDLWYIVFNDETKYTPRTRKTNGKNAGN